MLSTNLAGVGSKWERYAATVGLYKMLPTVSGVYMFVWAPELTFLCESQPADVGCAPEHRFRWVMYVGRSGRGDVPGSLRQRYEREYQHFIGRSPEEIWSTTPPTKREEWLARYLTLRPLEYWCLRVSRVQDVARIERHLIETFDPPLNDQHRTRSRKLRALSTAPAFQNPRRPPAP